MFLSWGVTLPLGIFIARFSKKVQAGVRSGTPRSPLRLLLFARARARVCVCVDVCVLTCVC
jgi:hypothetical protein